MIQKMPGQEKMVLDYYQKILMQRSIKGSIYEEKIISLIKSKIKLEIKSINTKRQRKYYPNLTNQMDPSKTKKTINNKIKKIKN